MHDRYVRCAYEVDEITASNVKKYISKTVWIQIRISVFICKFVLLYVGLRGRRKMSVNIETDKRTINLQDKTPKVKWCNVAAQLNPRFTTKKIPIDPPGPM